MAMTLEQQRAADAWQRSAGCTEEYTRLVKGVPALIMNSGLIQVLVHLQDKAGADEEKPHPQLGKHLREWLSNRFPKRLPDAAFAPFMQALMGADPQDFQQITAEAMAWLRWMRQIAPARQKLNAQTA